MKYVDFIKILQNALVEEGLRISQDKLKKIFEVTADVIVDNIEEDGKIPLKEFIAFKMVDVHPRLMPNGEYSPKQYGVKVELSDVYKKRLKEQLNK